jgi:hypothetical protein
MSLSNPIDLSRDIVLHDYSSAETKNRELFINNDVKSSSEYIFPNQKKDALNICNIFYETDVRVVSIVKRCKVGMDGLMIEVAKIMTTHSDDNFVVHRNKVFLITGMSNKAWEVDMKEKIPACFENNVSHHGKLQLLKDRLKDISDAIIIIDEIDVGDKSDQKVDKILKESNLLDVDYMKSRNIRFVFVSATIINELNELYKWGDIHQVYYMTIPKNYIGHKDFLELGIIQEWYPVNSIDSADRWIKEDILDNFGTDYRIHLIRTNKRNVDYIQNSCIKNKIKFMNHTSDDRISEDELDKIFNNITGHVVIAVKGLLSRANLIPNKYKLKIGAMHDRYVQKPNPNALTQSFPGRMSGYWRDIIERGHKTGPYRTSIEAIQAYEEFYNNPTGKIKGTKVSKKLFMNPSNIKNMGLRNDQDPPQPTTPLATQLVKRKRIKKDLLIDENRYRIYDNEEVVKDICKMLKYGYRASATDDDGFKLTSISNPQGRQTLSRAKAGIRSAYSNHGDKITWRSYFPCYENIEDINTLRFVVILRPRTTDEEIEEIDKKYKSL